MRFLFGDGRQCNYPLQCLTFFGSRGIQVSLPLLQSITTLRDLDLGLTNLRREGVEILIETMKYMNLTSLCLKSNHIGDEELGALLSIDKCQLLQHLDLSDNSIGKLGNSLVARFLHRNGNIQSFDISNNESMDSNDAKNLIDSISENSKLKAIHFGRNSNDVSNNRNRRSHIAGRVM